ncbi:hypothetical protein GALL_150920 [mine drainage metagenome]|uniref:DUF4845 domain-containing protein n=1 Tax=mine drainage metagenome TaxID=410659 RepID=A0A1J5SMI9_9ZZZZ
MAQHAMQQLNQTKKQGGATLIGMVIVAAALIFAAIVVMKMVPSYIEYFSVKKVLQAMGRESLSNMSKKEIMDSFDKRSSTAYVDVITGKDLIIEKNDAGETVVSAQYQVVKPIVANVSVLLDFNASSDEK